jgi:hypothetical protein
MTNKAAILSSKIKDLPVSENFYLRSKLMGFDRVQDIVDTPARQLIGKEDFDYNWLGELVSFLKNNNMLHTLQPIPGNRAY